MKWTSYTISQYSDALWFLRNETPVANMDTIPVVHNELYSLAFASFQIRPCTKTRDIVVPTLLKPSMGSMWVWRGSGYGQQPLQRRTTRSGTWWCTERRRYLLENWRTALSLFIQWSGRWTNCVSMWSTLCLKEHNHGSEYYRALCFCERILFLCNNVLSKHEIVLVPLKCFPPLEHWMCSSFTIIIRTNAQSPTTAYLQSCFLPSRTLFQWMQWNRFSYTPVAFSMLTRWQTWHTIHRSWRRRETRPFRSLWDPMRKDTFLTCATNDSVSEHRFVWLSL